MPDARRGRNPDVFDELEFERSRARASSPEVHLRSQPLPNPADREPLTYDTHSNLRTLGLTDKIFPLSSDTEST